MAKLVVNSDSLVSVADAIRTKGNTTDDLEFPQGFVDAVGAIESGGGGTEEIEQIIDQSGVLDSTEGTVEDKVGELIDYANFKNIIQESLYANGTNNNMGYMSIFRNTSVEDVSMFDFSEYAWLSNAFQNTKIKELELDLTNTVYIDHMCNGCSDLEKVVIKNMGSNIKSVLASFVGCSSLEIIEGKLDVSSCTQFSTGSVTHTFGYCNLLKEIRFIEGCIKRTISFDWSPYLTAESKQSIFDGLAAVETAQTLTFHVDAKILQSQVDSANAKGWTVAGGTVVSEEEYYG